jgi:hypothetical protein
MDATASRFPSSYRDPSGFVFQYNGLYYRQVNKEFAEEYETFMKGLYADLVSKSLIIPHKEISLDLKADNNSYKFLLPEQLPFISYPYEWSFDMLKDAALITLEIQKLAMKKSMTLKDASPYNLQWRNGKMVFIDTLSFESYHPEKPWIAYRQFCESFLAPLALMHYTNQPLQPMLIGYPEGIPLPVACSMLPFRSKINLHLYLHLHLNGAYTGKRSAKPVAKFSKKKLTNIIESLHSAISGLTLKEQTTWGKYYDEANMRDNYVADKKKVVQSWASELTDVNTVVDLGGNDGTFSKIVSELGKTVICADFDHTSINRLYKDQQPPYVQPVLVDFSQPTPAIGFNNSERMDFHKRAKSDLVLALALIHHLCIGRNLPLTDVVASLARIAKKVMIEFVPKDDPKVVEMLENKKDIYSNYTRDNFEKAFSELFTITRSVPMQASNRVLYLMERIQ